MNKLSELWDWLLPGLMSLCPDGAAYYNAVSEQEASREESRQLEQRALVRDAVRNPAVIHLARL